jgi:hypothetical protein
LRRSARHWIIGVVVTSVYSRAVRKAAELLGGREKLARTLQVPLGEVEKWIADKGKPPREIFLRVVDVIIDDSGISDASAPADAPPAKDCASGASVWLE